MQEDIRRKLAMATRALSFAQSNPSTDTGHVALVTQLADRLARAEVLARQQLEATEAEHAAIVRRDDARHQMHFIQLRHLIRIVKAAIPEHPELMGLFVGVGKDGSNQHFIVAAKSMLAATTANGDLLVSLGLGEQFIDELTAVVAEFDAQATVADSSNAAHIGARAELEEVARTCLNVVRRMDGFNQGRYRNNPELLAVWESASHVVGPFRRGVAAPTPGVPGEGGVATAAA
jgi:hypothetical protein